MIRTALITSALLVTGGALAEAQPVGDRIEVNGRSPRITAGSPPIPTASPHWSRS